MISYYKKIFLFNVKETWFFHKYKLSDIFSLNSFLHTNNKDGTKIWAVQNISHTIELNLDQDIPVIVANFSKQIRQQIRLAENEGTICYFHNEIDQFVTFFNDFALKKDTFTTSKSKIIAMGDSVKLSFAVNNGQVLAAHSYLVDVDLMKVRHLHSATKRLDEHCDRNLIGRANKYLTVRDIIYFKEKGFKVFDFGGYTKDTKNESLIGINNYKLLFGGEIVPCFDYYSYIYWMLKKVTNAMGLSGKL